MSGWDAFCHGNGDGDRTPRSGERVRGRLRPQDRYLELDNPAIHPLTGVASRPITSESYHRCLQGDCLPLCNEYFGTWNTVLRCARVTLDGGDDPSAHITVVARIQFHCS
jgi:hypothetical protein